MSATTRSIQWRRHHKKSKRGCQTCKARKVKCDEQHPVCRNCQRLDTQCEYDLIIDSHPASTQRRRSRVSPASSSQQRSISSSLSPVPTRSPERDNLESRARDMWLIHHYVTAMTSGMPGISNPAVWSIWAVAVPQMAFTHEFLLDAVLSASAFHLASLVTDDCALRALAHRYYGRALTRYREALAAIDAGTADPLCMSSVLLMFLTFRTTCLRSPDEPYEPPVDWFRMLHGMGHFIRCARSLDTCHSILTLLYNDHVDVIDPKDYSEVIRLQDIQSRLDSLPEFTDKCQEEAAALTCRAFGDALQKIMADAATGMSRHCVRRSLLALAFRSGEDFFRLIEARDVLVMIYLSHFFTLLRWAGGNWWFQKPVDCELARLSAAIPTAYRWASGAECVTREMV